MFDKTFFKFALGFAAIIAVSIGSLYIAGYFNEQRIDSQSANVR